MAHKCLDILIKNGRIVDGTGNPAYNGDIAIKGDKILEIGKLPYAEAEKVIDATGKFVCPGFIDSHSHSDQCILANLTTESTIRQGITTEIVGHCGMSAAPLTEESKARGSSGIGGFKSIDIPACTYSEFLEHIEQKGISENIAWIVGHNTLRNIAGITGAEYTQEQMKIMELGLREAMDAGVLGLSTGLEFEPGRSATSEEILQLVKIVAEYDGIYTSHIRNRDANILDALQEFLDIVKQCRIRGQVSHLNIRHNTGAPQNAWRQAVNMIERIREDGLDVLTDMTPLKYGIGQMTAILPQWIRRDEYKKIVEQLKDPHVRQRLRNDCDRYWRFIHRGEWDRVRIQKNPCFPEINGLSFPEIAERWGKDEWDCYFDILAEAGKDMDTIVLVGELFTEEHVSEAVSHPLFMLVVDGYSTKKEGALAEETRFNLHFMGMIHYLTYFVREKKVITLEEAIRKMTSMPATHYRLKKRGLLKEGYMADIAIFDLENLEETSTLWNPLSYARGMDYVLVNGVPVIDESIHTGARPGRNLLHK